VNVSQEITSILTTYRLITDTVAKCQDVIQDEKSETKIAHCETNIVNLHNEGASDQIKDHSRFYKGE
jgi:hypothetical protein